jgi:hypothetical protein
MDRCTNRSSGEESGIYMLAVFGVSQSLLGCTYHLLRYSKRLLLRELILEIENDRTEDKMVSALVRYSLNIHLELQSQTIKIPERNLQNSEF